MKHEELFRLAEVQLSYKINYNPQDRPKINTASDAYKLIKECWDENHIGLLEESKIIFLNAGNRVLGWLKLSSGGVSGTTLDPKLVFVSALKANASAIILFHNHPSGNLKASQGDIHVTRQIKEAGKLLGIDLFDHLIITENGYLSMAEEVYI